MVYNYKDLENKYKSDYQISKALENKEIFKIEKGIYSDKEFINDLEIIVKKYPNTIFTLDSAFYYHDLTDVIPKKKFLASKRSDSKINDNRVVQIKVIDSLFEIGKTNITVYNVSTNIYDKERMLIELVRNRKSMPLDYYKEIITNYRKISSDLDIEKLENYISNFSKEEFIFDVIQKEVF